MVGANPFERGLGRGSVRKPFVVVQDMFLTETAQRADVVLPGRSGLRKERHGHQCLRRSAAAEASHIAIGAKTDLEIIGLIAKEMGVAAELGPWLPDTVYNEIRKNVKATTFRCRCWRRAARRRPRL